MKTYLSILFILLSSSSCSWSFSEGKDKTSAKRNALAAELALVQVAETSSTLTTAYSNNELQSADDVALSFVDSIPILGNLVYLFTEDPDPTFDVESGLTTINNNLKVLNENIERIGTKVDQLSRTIDISVIQNQVATDKREISNCFTDFLLYLQNPYSIAEQDRLKSCYTKFSYVRQIGDILINKQMTFMQQPIFNQITEKAGYCDGEGIQDVYGFLLGLYIEGCSALITSEVLTYGNESTTYEDECKTTIQTANDTLNKIFNNCKTESFVTLSKSVSSGFVLYENEVFNYLTLSDNGVAYRIIIWSSDTNTHISGNYSYGIGYKETDVESIHNGIGLRNGTANGLTELKGFCDNSISTSYCNDDVITSEQTNSGSGNSFQDFLTSDQNISLSLQGWLIAVVIVAIAICFGLFVLLVIAVVVTKTNDNAKFKIYQLSPISLLI
ncbi:unnamed protein product [Mytilus coruscus]|uniref:Uncharacterized protein n=1 Tax=Mytilus coruscus TaxID=42192 RepID=A0A6J8B844_MYTCO|nr:unnamed protein product [Mytilus coruscus]